MASNPRHILSQALTAVDRGHSVWTQWPVIPAVPCPGRYGADVTSGRVGLSVTLSRCPAETAGVVESINET